MLHSSALPLSLFPTAAQDRLSEKILTEAFSIELSYVRAMNSFTRDLLISRAIEGHFVPRGWAPRSHSYAAALDELSHAILGHWSKLLTPTEREERRHVLFVFRILRRQYSTERNVNYV
jgi:hypothetical protein